MGYRRILREAFGLAGRQEVPAGGQYSRRSGGAVRSGLVSRIPGLRGKGMGGVFLQSARVDWVWPEIRARDREQLGRDGLPGPDGGGGCGDQAVSVDRYRADGRDEIGRAHV